MISEPECYHREIRDDDEVLILCSDGLLLVYSEEQIAKEIHDRRQEGLSLQETARRITDDCCTNYNCRDNVSLILIDLRTYRAVRREIGASNQESNQLEGCHENRVTMMQVNS